MVCSIRGFAREDGGGIAYARNLLQTLERRELAEVAGAGSPAKTGLGYAEIKPGDRLNGNLSAHADAEVAAVFALIERAHDFNLVPWRPVLEARQRTKRHRRSSVEKGFPGRSGSSAASAGVKRDGGSRRLASALGPDPAGRSRGGVFFAGVSFFSWGTSMVLMSTAPCFFHRP